MNNFTGFAYFIICIMSLIVFHELGHFLFARMFRVKVEVFSVGFGKAIAKKRDKDGTEWRLCCIPLGGYIRMLGFGESEEKSPGSFQLCSTWQKFLIIFAGPLFNYILAFAIFTSIYSLYGVSYTKAEVSDVVVNSPAALAGLRKGDEIKAINRSKVNKALDVLQVTRAPGTKSFILALKRNEKILNIHIKLPEGTKLGVSFNKTVVIKNSIPEAMSNSLLVCSAVSVKLTNSIKALVTGKESDAKISGVIGIMRETSRAASLGFEHILNLAAILSINLGFFNLLPIPGLDGSYLFGYLFTSLTGGRKPSASVRKFILTSGITLLFGLMVFTIFKDILSLLT